MEAKTWKRGTTRMDVTEKGVEIIGNYGMIRFECGGRVSHQEYLDGKYNKAVRNDFDEEVHREVMDLCQKWVQHQKKES